MKSLEGAIARLAEYQAATFKDFKAYVNPPEVAHEKAIINQPESGSFVWEGPFRIGTHTVGSDLLFSRHRGGSLPVAERAMRPYIEAYVDMLAAHWTLGGNINDFMRLDYDYGRFDYGDTTFLTIQFHQTFIIKTTVQRTA